MKKKIFTIVGIMLLLLSLCSCGSYPRVRLINSTWTEDSMTIEIGEPYKLSSFSKDFDDNDNITVTIIYEKRA